MTSFGYATISIIPSLAGIESKIETQLSSSSLGQRAGAVVGKNLSTGVEKALSTSLSGARFSQVFSASIRGNAQALTELGERANLAGRNIKSLATKSLSLSAVRQSAADLAGAGGLGGVASLLGAGGPWGIALAGAGVALAGFAQAQENAERAVASLTATLDVQTGAFTRKSLEDFATKLQENITSTEEWSRLTAAGFPMEGGIRSLQRGRQAVDDYNTALRQYGADHPEIVHLTDAYASALSNLSDESFDATEKFRLNKIGLDAINQIMPEVAKGADDTARAFKSIPSQVSIEVITPGMAEAMNNARTLMALLGRSGGNYSAGAAASDYAAGIASGKYKLPEITKPKMTAAGPRASGGQSSGGSGGGSSPAGRAVDSARDAFLQAIANGFARDLSDASPAQIGAKLSDLAKKARAALGGGTEARVLARIQATNDRLRPLARQRDALADQLTDATSNLASLRSSRSSAVESVRDNAIGSLAERSWSAKGVAELLSRRLAHLRSFRTDITTLAGRGLPQAFLNDLINAGPEAAWKVAHNLVTTDAGTFADVKSKALQLVSESTSFGKSAASLMYDSGISAAQGLVKGLTSQQGVIEKAMLKIAKGMQDAIKKALGIHSPSRVFAGLGAQIPAGLVSGIESGLPSVDRTVAQMASVTIPRGGIGAGRPSLTVNVDARGAIDATAVRTMVHAGVSDAFAEWSRATAVA